MSYLKKLKKYVGLCVIFFATQTLHQPALAGGWNSTGGEFLEDALNPWFIQTGNGTGGVEKKIIRYCIEADEVHFGVSKRMLSRQVQAAFSFWSEEFLSAHVPSNGFPGSHIYVGRESFFEVPCNDTDDIPLRFQFGFLTHDQQEKFAELKQDPRNFVGIAIRTDYDERTLSSKGFIYLSPATGPLAMAGRDIVPDPWSSNNSSNLNSILIHELGHVFGIQHRGTHTDLMGAGFAEYVVSPHNRQRHKQQGIFGVAQGTQLSGMCVMHEDAFARIRAFFNLEPGTRCIGVQVLGNKVTIESKVGWEDPWSIAGDIVLESMTTIRSEQLIRLWLPAAQSIFQNVPAFLGNKLAGPQIQHKQANGIYRKSGSSFERQMLISISPERLQLDGVVNGKIETDLIPLPL